MTVFSKSWCPYCASAKKLIKSLDGVDAQKIKIIEYVPNSDLEYSFNIFYGRLDEDDRGSAMQAYLQTKVRRSRGQPACSPSRWPTTDSPSRPLISFMIRCYSQTGQRCVFSASMMLASFAVIADSSLLPRVIPLFSTVPNIFISACSWRAFSVVCLSLTDYVM